MKRFIHSLTLFLILLLLAQAVQADRTVVRVKTNFGDIIIELFVDESPITVENFLDYANSDFYDGLIFHRVIENFVIQVGAYDPNLYAANPNNDPDYFRNSLWIRDPNFFHKPNDPIANESSNGISNLRGTIAMALVGGNSNSATSQFFINLSNANAFLDNQNFTVFGRVTSGMESVVDSISELGTVSIGDVCDPNDIENIDCFPLKDVPDPNHPPVIEDIKVILDFDSTSDSFANVDFIKAADGTIRTYVGQGSFSGLRYLQTFSSERLLGVDCLRIDQTAVPTQNILKFSLFLARDTTGKIWVLKYVLDDVTEIEVETLTEAVPLSTLGQEEMVFKLMAGNFVPGDLNDPNNTIVITQGSDVETQQIVSFTESLTNFPGFNNELILVRSTLGPGETTADWSWFHSSQGLVLDLVNHSLIQQNIDPESDGWRFLVPSPLDDLVIVLHAGTNRSKSRDAFVVRGTLGLSQVEFLNSTLFVFIDPFEFAIESTLFNQIRNSQVYIYRGSPDGQSRVLFKIDFSDGTFLITGKYIDLTGLDFPIRVEIAAGNYFGSGDAQIKKGKPLPMIFRMGVKDSLRVERFRYLKTDRPNSFTNRSLTVSGSIATKAFPFDLTGKAIMVHWGTKTMTIPGFSGFLGILRQGEKERFVYKRFPGVSNPIASAIFDFDRARFKIVINKTNLNDPTQSFKVSFDTINNETFDQTVTSVGIGRLPAESED